MNKKPIIAIIDSGISDSFKYKNDVLGSIGFCIEDDTLYATDDVVDESGHGTKCASIIKKYCPNATLYIIKIIQKGGMGYSFLLLQALEHLLDVDVDIINISLSVKTSVYEKEISELFYKLYLQNKIINVAVENGTEYSFPAVNSYCFGVKGKLSGEPLFNFYNDKEIQFEVENFPEFVQSFYNTYEWFGGNSKSTAIISGIMADMLAKNKITENCKRIEFIKSNINNYVVDNVECYLVNDSVTDIEINKMFEKCKSILRKYTAIGNITLDTALVNKNQSMISDVFNMLEEIGEKFNIKFDYSRISASHFSSVRIFLQLLCSLT